MARQLLRPVLGVTRLSTVDLSVSRGIGRLGDTRPYAKERWNRNLTGKLAGKLKIGLSEVCALALGSTSNSLCLIFVDI